MLRKFRRNTLRKEVGNRNLQSAWESSQRRRYGDQYDTICKKKGAK